MRPLTAEVDLDALIGNFTYLKKQHGGQVYAVVKADAYGHGALACSQALASYADGFAVAFLEEAITLRKGGIVSPILLLEGVFFADEYQAVAQYQLIPVIQNREQLSWFLNFSWEKPLSVWLKLDSGMHRAGFIPEDFPVAYAALSKHGAVKELILMSHFSSADELSNPVTAAQLKLFQQVCAFHPNKKSICNTAAVLLHPDARRDIARVGLGLYGVHPLINQFSDPILRPVLSLKSEVFAERTLRRGEKIGYGGVFTAPYDMRVGLIACGYADGYPRLGSSEAPVWIEGTRSRILGRVSMDVLSIELKSQAHTVGSSVELWGKNISINEIAARAKTIPYELLCHLKRARYCYCQKVI